MYRFGLISIQALGLSTLLLFLIAASSCPIVVLWGNQGTGHGTLSARSKIQWHYLLIQIGPFKYTYTLCPMCYGYIGSPKAGLYICPHEGAKRPREGWYILPLLVTQCFHSNEGRAYMVYMHDVLIFRQDPSLRGCSIMFIS